MPPFDVLELETPLFGAKLLEASAGTGKTFAIEHIFVRLLLEAPDGEEPLLLEQILAITFTKAAAREMRIRIRANLEKALLQLKAPRWPYLRPHTQSAIARRRLEDALLGFDRAQIFTIHGFCERSLAQFALEARAIPGQEDEGNASQTIRSALLDFLASKQRLCPEQLGQLLSKKRGISGLVEALLKAPAPQRGGSFIEDCARIQEAFQKWPNPVTLGDLRAEFDRLQPHFKTTGFKGEDFEEQLIALAALFAKSDDEIALRMLLYWQGSLFSFLSPANQKKAVKEKKTSIIFDHCIERLSPILESAMHPKLLFDRLSFDWGKKYERLLEEKGLFSPDYLLQRMKRALDTPAFLECIKQKYRAAIVDEFQDTDAVQWEIFRRIFFENKRLFYLVGDPKQSIYRFRQADLYTYFHARKTMGEGAQYSLDTNYRSTPALISALNDLFGDEQTQPWLWLPRENRMESYLPVKAGASHEWDPQDGKKALQFFATDSQSILAYVAQEIVRLRPHVSGYGSFAILVKDRTAAFEAQTFLHAHLLPCWAKSQSPLGDSLAMQALEELFEALYFPRDPSRLKVFLAGPFVAMSVDQLSEDLPILPLIEWKSLLDLEGIHSFFRAFFSASMNGRTIYERIRQRGSSFFRDVFQIVEQLLAISSSSLEVFKRLFRELQASDPDEDASARRRIENDEEAIQIMTMHASKGLEFDVVFALGAAAQTPKGDDEPQEIEAEKLRQLYVALTRAKLRLYLPLIGSHRKSTGAESPLELFYRRSKLGSDPQDIVAKLSLKNPHIGLDTEAPAHSLAPMIFSQTPLASPPQLVLPHAERKIFSYSSLTHGESGIHHPANDSDEKTLHTLPRGTETGILLHRIFERIFSEPIDASLIVAQELRFSPLQDWEGPIQKMVQTVLTMPIIDGCTLKESQNRTEIEFLFAESMHFLKGFIDLVFIWNERLYFLDWKTNCLGAGDESYSEEHLKAAMTEGDYWFQASLYAEALQRAWPKIELGGSIYLFLRGVDSRSRGRLFFQPQPIALDQRLWKK